MGAVALSIWVVPGVHVTGSYADGTILPLGGDTKGPQVSGSMSRNQDGFYLPAKSSGSVRVRVRIPRGSGSAVLRVWADAPSSGATTLAVSGPLGSGSLGRAGRWVGEPFDVSGVAQTGQMIEVQLQGLNRSSSDVLVLDQLASGVLPANARQSTPAWLFSAWVALIAASGIALVGRLWRHWPLIVLMGSAAVVFWNRVLDSGLLPLESGPQRLWDQATSADLLSLHSGLLSGSFTDVSHLAAQLFALTTPVAGEGFAGARTASVLAALAAIAMLYVTGNRVAGRWGAIVAVCVGLAADPFRLAAASGSGLPVIVLAATVFLIAIHACLAETSRYAAGLLGAAGAVAVLAEPLWLPGVVLTLAVLAWLYGTAGQGWRVLGVGMLVLVIALLPNRISVADQNDGDLFADIGRRAVAARNIEFAGRGHGAVLADRLLRDPYGGRKVGLTEYLLGDHSPSVVLGASLAGTEDAIGRFASRDESKLAGLLAFAFGILGTAYLLLVPRLRLLVLLPWMVAMPTLFIASRTASDAFVGGVMLWPAFVVSAGVLAYALARLGAHRFKRLPRPLIARSRRRTQAPSTDARDEIPNGDLPDGDLPDEVRAVSGH